MALHSVVLIILICGTAILVHTGATETGSGGRDSNSAPVILNQAEFDKFIDFVQLMVKLNTALEPIAKQEATDQIATPKLSVPVPADTQTPRSPPPPPVIEVEIATPLPAPPATFTSALEPGSNSSETFVNQWSGVDLDVKLIFIGLGILAIIVIICVGFCCVTFATACRSARRLTPPPAQRIYKCELPISISTLENGISVTWTRDSMSSKL